MTPFLFSNDSISKAPTFILGAPENNWTPDYHLLGDCFILCDLPTRALERSSLDPWEIGEGLKVALYSGIFIVFPNGMVAAFREKKKVVMKKCTSIKAANQNKMLISVSCSVSFWIEYSCWYVCWSSNPLMGAQAFEDSLSEVLLPNICF